MSRLGHPRVHLRRTSSTNDGARALAAAGAPHGTLVTAGEQSAGRGRQGRSWVASPGGALLMSLLLRDPPALLPLAAAVAVCEVAGEGALIKWPNDVVVVDDEGEGDAAGLAKLAGILTEGRPQEGWAILGIGLNVADAPPLPDGRRAASLGLDAGAVEPTLARLLEALERRLGQESGRTLAAWRERDALRGREVAWSGGSGLAEGIDGEGRLVVALADGGHTALSAGEVHLRQVGSRRRTGS
jgi:BirA family biotin operon repressor/biotin-[acetyl-CoA-carboxylase] ligase